MMWSAVNWLTQKAGINLDDANEVLNCSDSSYNQQAYDDEDQTNDSSNENLSNIGHGVFNSTSSSKRARRSPRWSPPNGGGLAVSTPHHSNTTSINNAAATLPITSIIVPMGIAYRVTNAAPVSPHPVIPPVMVPTGARSGGTPGYGLVSPPGAMGMATKHSPLSMHWKEISMAADVNSPGFAYRIARQAERQTELGSRIYPTVQEKYLHAKHLPNVKLRGTPKPVLAPHKLRSVPLVPLASPNTPSPLSSVPSIDPILNNPASNTATMFPPTTNVPPSPDFRTDFFAAPSLRQVDGRLPLPGLLDNSNSSFNNNSGISNNNSSLGGMNYESDLEMSSISVTASLTRNGPDLLSSLDGRNMDEEVADRPDDPTALRAVLAALNKSQSGKGVKRARITEFDDSGSKRQCSDSASLQLDQHYQAAEDKQSNGEVTIVHSYGGEKRALDTSSSSSFDNSGHGSPCAKIARTAAEDDSHLDNFKGNCHQANSIGKTSDSGGNSMVSLSAGLDGGDVLSQAESNKHKRRCVNPWIASMSSSRKMLRERSTYKTESICLAMDNQQDDSDSDDKSSDDSDQMSENSVAITGEDSEVPTTADDDSPAAAVGDGDHDSNKSSSGGGGSAQQSSCGELLQSTSPHIVSLAAHRSHKQATHTRLNRMLGMLFHLTDEEIESAASPVHERAATSTVEVTTANIISANSAASSFPVPQSLFVSGTPSASIAAAELLPPQPATFTFPLKVTPQTPVLDTAGFTNSNIPVSTCIESDFSAPTTIVSESLAEGRGSSATTFSDAGASENSLDVASDLSRAVTLPLPAPSVPDFGSSVSASFTFSLAKKADGHQEVVLPPKNTTPALPPYEKVEKTGQVIDGASNLLAFLSSNAKSTTENFAPPAFTLGSGLNAGTSADASVTNAKPLLPELNTSSKDAPSKHFEAVPNFSLPSGISFMPGYSSPATSSSVSAAQPIFSFGTAVASASSPNSVGSILHSPSIISSKPTAAVAETTAALPPLFSFGTTKNKVPSSTSGSSNLFSFGGNASKQGLDTVNTASPAGYPFGSVITTGLNKQSDNTLLVPPVGGFTFGAASSTQLPQLQQEQKPLKQNQLESSVAKSLFPSVVSDSNGASTVSSNSSIVSTPLNQDSVSTASSLFNFASSAPSTTAAASSLPGIFSFGATTNISTKDASNAAAEKALTSTCTGMFPYVSNVNNNSTFGSSSTSATFTFTPSTTTNSSTLGANVASPFKFGTVSSTTAPPNQSVKNTSSPFTFGNIVQSNINVANSDRATANKSSTSLFSFGSSSAVPAFGGVISTTADTSNSNTSNINASSVTFGGPGIISPNSSIISTFGSASTINPRSFGAPAVSTPGSKSTTAFGAFASPSNFFPGASIGVNPSDKQTFTFGANAASNKPAKSVSFGPTTVLSSGNNMFGQPSTSEASSSSSITNLFGQQQQQPSTDGMVNAGVFGQSLSSGAVPTFGSSAFGQPPSGATATSISADSNTLSSGATASPFQFGASATNLAGTSFAFGGPASNSASTFGSPSSNPVSAFGAPSANATILPNISFGSGSGSSATTVPSFGLASPSFGSASANPVPSFGTAASGPMTSFGTASALGVQVGGGGMFQFSSGVTSPSTPQQQQTANAFSAGTYTLGGQVMPGTPQDTHNLFSVGGTTSSGTSRRPRVRAHRRNR